MMVAALMISVSELVIKVLVRKIHDIMQTAVSDQLSNANRFFSNDLIGIKAQNDVMIRFELCLALT
jgi:hypothetical protein